MLMIRYRINEINTLNPEKLIYIKTWLYQGEVIRGSHFEKFDTFIEEGLAAHRNGQSAMLYIS
ncbi:hypothetical protein SQ11_04260 [Nitrosospira sp. NpAV]|nr:hypothetical protein SQ11_04260 [Nitrosospira sp. NpAV]